MITNSIDDPDASHVNFEEVDSGCWEFASDFSKHCFLEVTEPVVGAAR